MLFIFVLNAHFIYLFLFIVWLIYFFGFFNHLLVHFILIAYSRGFFSIIIVVLLFNFIIYCLYYLLCFLQFLFIVIDGKILILLFTYSLNTGIPLIKVRILPVVSWIDILSVKHSSWYIFFRSETSIPTFKSTGILILPILSPTTAIW